MNAKKLERHNARKTGSAPELKIHSDVAYEQRRRLRSEGSAAQTPGVAPCTNERRRPAAGDYAARVAS